MCKWDFLELSFHLGEKSRVHELLCIWHRDNEVQATALYQSATGDCKNDLIPDVIKVYLIKELNQMHQ